MAQTVKGNKNSASEDTIGMIHNLIAQVLYAKLQNWMTLISAGGNPDLIVDMKALGNAIKFVDVNGVVAADLADDTRSEIHKKLEEIKQKQGLKLVSNGGEVPFTDEEDYN